MLKVYGSVQSRAAMVLVTLENLGVPYEHVDIATRSDITQSDEYRLLNPTGKVPTLQDGEFILFETQAILFYLVRKYGNGQLWASSVEGEADIWRWSLYISNQLEVPALDLLLQTKYAGGSPDEIVIENATQSMKRFLPLLETQLTGKDYLTGTKTIADIHGATVIGWAKVAGFDFTPYPNVHAWIHHMANSAESKKVAGLNG